MSQATAKSGGQSFHFRKSAKLLETVMESAPVGMALAGTDGRVIFANRSFGEMFGYTPAACIGLGLADFVHPDDEAKAVDQVEALTRGDIGSYSAERRYRRKDGSLFWGRVSGSVLRDERTGRPIYFILQLEDIEEQKLAQAALVETESRWNFALEGAGQGVWDHDLKNGRVFYSRMWRQMRGFGLDEEIDGSREAWLARVHPDDRERIRNQAIRQNSGELEQNSFEYRERHRDGRWIWILSRGKPIEWMPDGSVARIIGTDTDITSIKLEEARAAEEAAEIYRRHLAALEKAHEATEAAHQLAQSLARHDSLTGLPNRRVFSEALGSAIARANRGADAYAILIIDLDRFKPVNDIYGHAVGDDVLREIATRLRGIGRKNDTLARLGGDEFGAILECDIDGETPRDAAVRLANEVIDCIQQPISVGDRSVEIGASIGIALSPTDGSDSETLLRAADMAMYRAKEGGSGPFCFFQHDMEVDLRTRAALEEDVRRAVVEEAIQPYYQPLIELSEQRLVGFEVLARWHHLVRGKVPPDVFIPVVERLGLINQLTYSLLRRACLDALHWPSDITIAINVSPKHFNDPVLPVKFLAILSETGFPPRRLEIEVTETALVSDPAAVRAVLMAFQELGIKISLDDFGMGYSSLYHLRELRFDKIKIDRSFVTSMLNNRESAKIVNSVIALAKNLGLPAVAEGIEKLETINQLTREGAQYGQGYYFGRAMPAEEADKLVQASIDVAVKRRA